MALLVICLLHKHENLIPGPQRCVKVIPQLWVGEQCLEIKRVHWPPKVAKLMSFWTSKLSVLKFKMGSDGGRQPIWNSRLHMYKHMYTHMYTHLHNRYIQHIHKG